MNAAHIPNIITALRIVGTFGLIFTKTFDIWFYIVYAFTGVTDVLDGFVARKLKVTSEFGSKLDSGADIFFNLTLLVKIFPALWTILPGFIWGMLGLILILRISSYIVAALKFHRFASLHTYMNKLTVFFVFLVPFFVYTPIMVWLCGLVAVLGVIATAEELMIHLRSKEYTSDIRGIKQKNKA